MKCFGSVNSKVSYVPYTLLLIRIEEFTTVWLVYDVFIYLWTVWEILFMLNCGYSNLLYIFYHWILEILKL
jgi:hypothetical protein